MFLGHINDLKDTEWRVYNHLKEWTLHNTNGTYSLSSNICPHQGSYLKDTAGKNTRFCPYHGWSFKVTGEPMGSGTTSCKNHEVLASKEVYIWNGFLFSEPHDLPDLEFINTEHLQLEETRVDIVNANWTAVLDLFLDVDHIPVVHPKVYSQLNPGEVVWDIKENTSTQLVPTEKDFTNDYTESFLESDATLPYGSAWLTVYPYSMLEWQPGAWFITVCKPKGEQTEVTVYKYRDTRYSDINWQLNEQIWETAWSQDCAQSESMIPGFNTKYPEQAKAHFYEWIKQHRL